jgi:hypothetical protein
MEIIKKQYNILFDYEELKLILFGLKLINQDERITNKIVFNAELLTMVENMKYKLNDELKNINEITVV